jgi:gamma-glutamyltranspeptidase/glutathione hydrolase
MIKPADASTDPTMLPPINRRSFLSLTAGMMAAPFPLLGADATPGKKGLVLGHPESAEAGLAVLEEGGNAADAIVAGALVAGVTAVTSCGIGGYGGTLVVARPDGQVSAIDFNSTAPAAARPDMFPVDDKGVVKDQVNRHGWLAAGVPGTLAGLQLLLDRYGTRKLAQVVHPAIRYAREGFAVNKKLATGIKAGQVQLRRDPGTAKLFFPSGEPLAEGAHYRNPDLAGLLEKLAERGSVDSFYRGDIARRIAEAFRRQGGLVSADDLAAYRAQEVMPLTLSWRGHTIATAPLTAGGLSVLQALAVLKALEWEKWDRKDPATTHARLEALRIAWHDRLSLLGDPAQVEVPVARLLSERQAAQSAERVRKAVRERKPVAVQGEERQQGGTIHLTAADSAGMMVALTLTHGEGLGAQVAVDGLGLILGHGMSRFDPRPGRPNSPGPGKRPLHNMCPTIVSRGGKPMLALGATGGRRIPNTIFDVLSYRIGEGRTLEEAVQAPRWHTEGDLRLNLEAKWPAAQAEYLKQIGYSVKAGGGANLNAIEREAGSGAVGSAAR